MSKLDHAKFMRGQKVIDHELMNEVIEVCRMVKGMHAAPPLKMMMDRSGIGIYSSFAASGAGGAGGGIPCKITSNATGNGPHTADLYADGYNEDATTIGVQVYVPQIAAAATLTADTWLLVTPIGDHYEGQVPVWVASP